MTADSTGYNRTHSVDFGGGWSSILARGQAEAVGAVVDQLNRDGRCVVAMTPEAWALRRRVSNGLLLLITLGFVGKTPGLLLVSAPQPDRTLVEDPPA